MVKPEIGAKRIFKDKREEERYGSAKEEEKALKERLKSDIKRYKKYYGIKDLYDLKNYDITIDSSKMSIKEAEKAVEKAVLTYTK
jgi:cytidylate kinase